MKRMSCFLIGMLVLSLASCNLSLYTSKFNEQEVVEEDEETQLEFSGDAPSLLVATKAMYTDSIVLTWTSVRGADYYEIQKKGEDESSFHDIPVSIEGTTYTDDDGLETGKRYSYRVCAKSDSVRVENAAYSPIAYGSLLSSPTTIEAGKGTSAKGVMLQWTQVPDVRSYRIYASTSQHFDTTDNLVGTVTYNPDADYRQYFYTVQDSEAGENIYFKVSSVSDSMEAPLSSYRIGYSSVVGSPSAPANLRASQGVGVKAKTNPLTLLWDADADATGYLVYRSAPGLSETLVYPYTEDDDSLKDTLGGQKTFVDSRNPGAFQQGVRYTYTVIPTVVIDSKVVKGPDSSVDSYLLSNPTSCSVVLSAGPVQTLNFKQVLGLSTAEERSAHSAWKYVVSKSADGVTYGEEEDIAIPDSDTVTYTYSGSEYRYFSLKVVNPNGGDDGATLVETDALSGLKVDAPATPEGFSATSNVYVSGTSANANGVYPITVKWMTSDIIDKYVLKRFSSGVDVTTAAPLETKEFANTVSSYSDVMSDASFGTSYQYTIQSTDILGQVGPVSDPVSGYGAVTPETLVKWWTIYSFKPWENISSLPESMTNTFFSAVNLQSYWKDGRIYYRINKGNQSSLSDQMDALGEETQTCHYAHGSHKGASGSSNTTDFGSCYYNASMEGVGGYIKFVYKDFSEIDAIYTNGSYEMHVNASGTGSASSSGFKISGMYPATITLGNITVVSKTFQGNYSVVMQDGQGTVSVNSAI